MGKLNTRGKLVILLAGVFSVFLLLVVFSGVWDSNQKISKVVIENAIIVPKNEIKDSISKKIINTEKRNLNLNEIEDFILNNPYIKSVNFKISGSKLIIRLNERKPFGIYTHNFNKLYFFDKDGYVLPFNKKIDIGKMSVIKDIYISKNKINKKIIEIVRLISFLNNGYELILSNINYFTYDYKHNSIAINLINSQKILINNNQIELKLRTLKELILINYNDIDNHKIIDMRWDDMIVLK